jgi:hypothetical protein
MADVSPQKLPGQFQSRIIKEWLPSNGLIRWHSQCHAHPPSASDNQSSPSCWVRFIQDQQGAPPGSAAKKRKWWIKSEPRPGLGKADTTIDSKSVFKWRHFQGDIIVPVCAGTSRHSLELLDLEESMAERGLAKSDQEIIALGTAQPGHAVEADQ